MTIDLSYVIQYAILAVIEFTVFLFSYSIYRKTKGASLTYKMWAIGTFILFISSIFYLICAIPFECNEQISNNKNEIHRVIGGALTAFGYFYIPLGLLYLSKDFDVGDVNQKMIKKIQIIFFSVIILISIFFIILSPLYKILNVVSISFNFLYFLVWVFSIYEYKPLYNKILKQINVCWILIYIAMIGGILSEVFNILLHVFSFFEYLMLISQLVMAFGFISGFYKLAEMVEAV